MRKEGHAPTGFTGRSGMRAESPANDLQNDIIEQNSNRTVQQQCHGHTSVTLWRKTQEPSDQLPDMAPIPAKYI